MMCFIYLLVYYVYFSISTRTQWLTETLYACAIGRRENKRGNELHHVGYSWRSTDTFIISPQRLGLKLMGNFREVMAAIFKRQRTETLTVFELGPISFTRRRRSS